MLSLYVSQYSFHICLFIIRMCECSESRCNERCVVECVLIFAPSSYHTIAFISTSCKMCVNVRSPFLSRSHLKFSSLPPLRVPPSLCIQSSDTPLSSSYLRKADQHIIFFFMGGWNRTCSPLVLEYQGRNIEERRKGKKIK